MNHNQYTEFKKIAESIDNSFHFLQWQQIKDIYQSAVLYNKLQNNLLKDEYIYDPVKTIYLYDEILKEARWIPISAKHNLSRKEWFKILYASQLHKTAQQIEKILNIKL